MAILYADHIDLGQKEIRNPVAQNLTADPTTPIQGQWWWRSDTKQWKFYDGTAVQTIRTMASITSADITDGTIVNADINAAAGIAYGKLSLTNSIVNADIAAGAAIAYGKLALTNTIVNADVATAAAIAYTKLTLTNSIVNTDVSSTAAIAESKLSLATDAAAGTGSRRTLGFTATQAMPGNARQDQIAVPTAAVSWNNQKLTSLADGTATTDAATWGQVQTLINGFNWKDDVRVVAVTNVNLASVPTTLDGVALADGDRILLTGQTAGAENGIYSRTNSTTWVRASDADSATKLQGASVIVREGTTYADSWWLLTTDNITLGTTPLTWTRMLTLTDLVAGAGLSKTGSTLDVNVDSVTTEIVADQVVVKRASTAGTVPVAQANGTFIWQAAPALGSAAPVGTMWEWPGDQAPIGTLMCDGSPTSRATYPDLFAAITIPVTGDTTNASPTITNVSGTTITRLNNAGVPTAGAVNIFPISGPGIPAGAYVRNATGTTITLSANATATATAQTLSVAPWGVGDGSTTFNVPDMRSRSPLGAGTGTGLTNRRLADLGGEESHVLSTAEMPNHTHTIGSQNNQIVNGSGSGANAGLTQTGGAFTVQGLDSAGGGGSHNTMQPWRGVNYIIQAIKAAAGGGGGSTIKYAQAFGDASATAYTITHNLASTDVVNVFVRRVSDGQEVRCGIQVIDANNISVQTGSPPGVNAYRVVVSA